MKRPLDAKTKEKLSGELLSKEVDYFFQKAMKENKRHK